MHDHILAWAEDDRPREKLLLKGSRTLSDAELLAILLGSGSPNLSAVSLARQLLQNSQNELQALARMPFHKLCEVKGIGKAKAVTLMAAFELGRRKSDNEPSLRKKVASSLDVYQQFSGLLGDLNHEEFWILMLNRANVILDKRLISRGGISGTVADPKLIFAEALSFSASAIVLVHNHPSGNLSPSQADIELTRKLQKGGEFLTLPILDHLIVTANGYYSFADEGNI